MFACTSLKKVDSGHKAVPSVTCECLIIATNSCLLPVKLSGIFQLKITSFFVVAWIVGIYSKSTVTSDSIVTEPVEVLFATLGTVQINYVKSDFKPVKPTALTLNVKPTVSRLSIWKLVVP